MPSQAQTVQAGLDSLQNTDTLFIELGTYEELLNAPSIHFVVIGQTLTDSILQSRPILDGSNLPAEDTTAALRLPLESALTMRNIVVRHVGRVGIFSWADSVVMSNCQFERMDYGFWHRPDNTGADVRMDSCTFDEVVNYCVAVRRGNSFTARNCSFRGIGDRENALVITGKSDIQHCEFSSTRTQMLLGGFFGPHYVANCVFGPSEAGDAIDLVYLSSGSIDFLNNTFRDCLYGSHALHIYSNAGDSVRVTNNRFERCIGLDDAFSAQGVVGTATPNCPEPGTQIIGNSFVNCSGNWAADCIASSVSSPALISDNQFISGTLNGVPSVMAGSSWQPTPATLINNRFENCGYAVDLSAAADARDNYWGHNSGPFHATSNPGGLGDTITGDVPFIPWLIDSADAAEDNVVLPLELTLRVFPNPFNARTGIQFTLEQRGRVELRVYDLLGREVALIVDAVREAGTHHVEFDGSALASGLYFARLTTPRASRVARLLSIK